MWMTHLASLRPAIAARCPAARLHIVEGGGHMLLARLDDIVGSLTAGGQ